MTDEYTDTPPHVTRLQRELFQQRTGEERLRMACAMSDAARPLVLASLPEAVRNDPSARRAALLQRFYGRELGPERIAAILAYWRDYPPPDEESLLWRGARARGTPTTRSLTTE